jgi:hypothetical protein
MLNERSVRQNLGLCGLSNRSTAQRGGTNVDVAIDPTGLILQELHQGFADARARKDWIERFSALPLLIPDRADHVNAAEIPNLCRRSGIQIGTIDALLPALRKRARRNGEWHSSLAPWYWKRQYIIRIGLYHFTERGSVWQR